MRGSRLGLGLDARARGNLSLMRQTFKAWSQAVSGAVGDAATLAQQFKAWSQSASGAEFPLSRSPLVWFDAAVGVTLNSGNISNWTDRSGNGHDAAQATGVNQPGFTASDSGWNNRPSMTCSATTFVTTVVGTTIASQPNTIYLLCDVTSSTGNVVDGGASRQLLSFNGAWKIFAGSQITASGGNSAVKAHVMLAGVFNGASSALYVNDMSTNLISGNPSTNALSPYVIGSSNGSSGPTGSIPETLIVSGADSLAQRQAMASYFATKYNKSYA